MVLLGKIFLYWPAHFLILLSIGNCVALKAGHVTELPGFIGREAHHVISTTFYQINFYCRILILDI